jgi:hypothetical protein
MYCVDGRRQMGGLNIGAKDRKEKEEDRDGDGSNQPLVPYEG